MASGWVKSLQCKSRAWEDVYHPNKNPKRLIPSASCSGRSVNDDVAVVKTKKKKKPKKKADPEYPAPAPRVEESAAWSSSLTEVAKGHPSRKVVEMIFETRWGESRAFAGRVELVFKVDSGSKARARFEEYREEVRSEEDARCAAHGNEVMGFHCSPSNHASSFSIFSASGAAHNNNNNNNNNNSGARAMMVCRVVAGRLGIHSLPGRPAELLLFDSRAVLPCFLIIYHL